MKATEHLRALLNERGVEWREDVWKPDRITEWESKYGTVCAATSWETMGNEWLHLCFYSLTPEEVLAATLGCGECEIVSHYEASTRGEVGRERVKLSCGHIVERHSKYCQECGRKIKKAVKR